MASSISTTTIIAIISDHLISVAVDKHMYLLSKCMWNAEAYSMGLTKYNNAIKENIEAAT